MRLRAFWLWSGLAWALATGGGWPPAARGDEAPPELAISGSTLRERHTLPPARSSGLLADRSRSRSSGWWLGTAGIALALAAFGVGSLAARRALPGRAGGPLEIVGRLSLSPKHAVYLVRAGEHTLVVGTGAQGPPALLGEWAELRAAPAPEQAAAGPAAVRLDRPFGGER